MTWGAGRKALVTWLRVFLPAVSCPGRLNLILIWFFLSWHSSQLVSASTDIPSVRSINKMTRAVFSSPPTPTSLWKAGWHKALKWTHLQNITAVDDQHNNENGQIINKETTKVSFKFLCPWPFQSFEIKWPHFYCYKSEDHGEFLYKLVKKWHKPDTSVSTNMRSQICKWK